MLDNFLDEIADLAIGWLALAAFLLPFGETVAFLDLLVPGEVGLVFVGAAADTPGRVLIVFGAGTLGAFCGDSLSWYIGHRWGIAVLSRWPALWRHAEPRLEEASAHFAQHGGRSIFVARFIAALRALAPLAAGAAGLEYRRFAPWNAAASVLWVGIVVTLGAVFGEAVVSFIDRFSVVVSVVAVALLIAWFTYRRVRARAKVPAPDE